MCDIKDFNDCLSDAYEAEQLLKEVDIHSVTGVLKLYLRELPEALFTDALYPEFTKAWGAIQVLTIIIRLILRHAC